MNDFQPQNQEGYAFDPSSGGIIKIGLHGYLAINRKLDIRLKKGEKK